MRVWGETPELALRSGAAWWRGLGRVFGILACAYFTGIITMALSKTQSRQAGKTRALSERAKGKESSGCGLIGFGLIFFLVGLAMLVWMVVIPLAKVYEARSWPAVPCAVVSSRVKTHSSSDGTTYSVEMVYQYEIDGQPYTSDERSFGIAGSSSGHKGKARFVADHPPGHKMTCYVDPSDPTRAVLDKGVGRSFFWAFFPLPFIVAGFFILRAGVKRGRGDGKGADWRPDVMEIDSGDRVMPVVGESDAGPVVLRPSKQRVGGAIGLLAFGLLWNGIISIPISQSVRSWSSGKPDVCLLLFMIPFAAVGIGVMVMWLRQVMLVFAPVIELELDRAAVALGESFTVKWRVKGRLWRLTSMTIVLAGQESATYRRGTNTVTDTHTFLELAVAGADGSGQSFQTLPAVPERGSATVTIPLDTMHSFEAPNNKIMWSLKVASKVHRWPDPKDSYDITVLPKATDATG